jgi:hydroxymethylpyrimidine pyrophosphatase-like HAD family hydrolase
VQAVTSRAGTYAAALGALQHRYGIRRAETLAIVGAEDAHQLFECAAVRVAMHDADERVLLSAEWEAPARDGIAATLERYGARVGVPT